MILPTTLPNAHPARRRNEPTDANRIFLKNIADDTISLFANFNWKIPETILYPADYKYEVNKPKKSKHLEPMFLPMTTLEGAQYLKSLHPKAKVAILSFADARNRGGGFQNGAEAQEESIARSSTLYLSLKSGNAAPFYKELEGGGFHSHAIIYSRDVIVFRGHSGDWIKNYDVDVLSCAAVDAGKVRKTYNKVLSTEEIEKEIEDKMEERMSRILAVFKHRNVKNIVLGSFGTGVFENNHEFVARKWHSLLKKPEFISSFDNVVFAITGVRTIKVFWNCWYNDQTDPVSYFFGDIAQQTLAYVEGNVDISKILKNTIYYSSESVNLSHPTGFKRSRQKKCILRMTTLQGAKFLASQNPTERIAILNFGSATKPCGEFLTGVPGQEESIARSSTLFHSLTSDAAAPFYKQEQGGFHSHAMIYSRDIIILLEDSGNWINPYCVDVLTCAAVNADLVRNTYSGPELENEIGSKMKDRMGKILTLFEHQNVKNIVIGSFGTGKSCQNGVENVAKTWYHWLNPSGFFSHSFDNVVFAIPDKNTFRKFYSVWETGYRVKSTTSLP